MIEDIPLSSPTLPSSSHPHPVPPFFQTYSPCPWLAMRKAKPGEIWKVLSHELAQETPIRVSKYSTQESHSAPTGYLDLASDPMSYPWLSALGLAGHSNASLLLSSRSSPHTHVLAPASPPVLAVSHSFISFSKTGVQGPWPSKPAKGADGPLALPGEGTQ